MLGAAIARVVEDSSGRRPPGERPVVAHVDPQSAGVGLALGEYRDGRVVAVQALGCEDMRLEALEERHQRRSARADLVGERRQAQRHALAGVALSLAVKRLVLTE